MLERTIAERGGYVTIEMSPTFPQMVRPILTEIDLADADVTQELLDAVCSSAVQHLRLSTNQDLSLLNFQKLLQNSNLSSVDLFPIEAIRSLPTTVSHVAFVQPPCHSNRFLELDQESQLANLTSLTSLRIRLTTPELKGLSTLKQLESLNLHGSSLSSLDFEDLSGLSALQTLILNSCDLSDENLEKINKIPSIAKLHLANNRLTKKSLVHLSRLPQLRLLDISCTEISSSSFGPYEWESLMSIVFCESQIDSIPEALRTLEIVRR